MRVRNPTFAAFTLALCGCAAVIGIDDAHVDATFHPGASAGGAGAAGAPSQGGASALAGASGTTSGSGGQSGDGGASGAIATGGTGATGGAMAGGNGGMAPGGMAGMPAGGMGGMGPGMGGMGPGMGGMPAMGMGGMGCGTNAWSPAMNGGAVVVVVSDCSGKTGATPQLRVAAHPNNNQMNPPNMAPYFDMNPMLPETATLTPGDGTYVIDAILDYPPFINPPAPPSGMDAVSSIGNVAVQGPMGANVTLWLH